MAKSPNAETKLTPESSSQKVTNKLPKVTLSMLKEKSERLEQEKKALEVKLAEKLDDKVLEDDDLMSEEEEYSSEEIQFGTMPKTTLSKTSINMVFTLPEGFQAIDVSSDSQSDIDSACSSLRDYLVPDSDDEGVLSLDVRDDGDSCRAINTLPFGKPTKEMANQIKPLYMKAKFDGMPINKILIDSGAGINVITMSTLRKLGKTKEDLFEPVQTLTNFTGGVEQAVGMLPIEVKIGSKKKLTGFYVLDAAVSYNALLGRDWIHSTRCIPSSLHQSLIFWKGDNIELVKADQQPFEGNVNTAEAKYYNAEERPIDCRNFYGGHYKKLIPESDMENNMATPANPINLYE